MEDWQIEGYGMKCFPVDMVAVRRDDLVSLLERIPPSMVVAGDRYGAAML